MKHYLNWLLPILFLALLAPFTPYLDLLISNYFYTPDVGFYNNAIVRLLFHYGEIFGLGTGALASLIFLLTYLKPKWKKWRQGAFAITATLVIGAGLLTNVLLKGYWGRPRPKQIEQFGGHYAYRPFWQPNFAAHHEPQKSFPSGHVAMGFYFLSVCLVARRTQTHFLYVTGMILTVGLGGGLMITRVVQGGHFFSDVIVSPILMWLVALAVVKLTWGEVGERILSLKQCDTNPEPDEISAA